MKKILTTFFLLAVFFAFGAHSAQAAAVYYSVGQNTSNHMTGTPTVTVSGTTATFSVAQTATNMGVGDIVTYTGGTCYISGKTSTTVWSCVSVTGGTPNAATAGTSVTSIAHVFTSLEGAVDANNANGAFDSSHLSTKNLVTGGYQLYIPCYYDSGPDTTAVVVQGWTTGVSNYITIYTPSSTATQVNQSQRHSGKWTTNAYRMETSLSNQYALNVYSANYTRVDGLQVKTSMSSTGWTGGIWLAGGNTGSNLTAYFSNNIAWGILTSNTFSDGLGAEQAGDSAVLYMWNNIAYGYNYAPGNGYQGGFYFSQGTLYAYNNTAYGNNIGINNNYEGYNQVTIAKNNLAYGNVTDYVAGTAFNSASTNNLSQDATAPALGTYYRSKTVTFVNAAGSDFHLSALDSAAQNAGYNASADGNLPFNTDIDGDARPQGPAWDIGADEQTAPQQVYYSVGQNSNDNKVASTVTIASGAAVFSAPQTGNIGVGDRVTYNSKNLTAFANPGGGYTTVTAASNGFQNGDYVSIAGTTNYNGTWVVSSAATNTFQIQTAYVANDATGTAANIAYISAKTNADQMHWTLANPVGTNPANVSSLTVNSITHEFTSLENAITLASNSSHINNASLTTANVVLNIPCYYDTGADTTAAVVSGYTTSATNYLKIYTPVSTSAEANFSQRHSGVWNAAKYELAPASGIPLTISNENVRTDGLEIQSTNDNGISVNGAAGTSNVYASNNIISGNATAGKYGIYLNSTGASSKAYFWNNIEYNYSGTSAIGMYQNNANWTTYLYNNTFYANTTGINENAGSMVAKNNIANGNTTDYAGTFSSSSTNNISQDATVPAYGTYYPSKTVSFVNTAGQDFHLSPTDTAARNSGVNLSQDPNLAFSTDIDGQNRSGTWDIGADQTYDTQLQNQQAQTGITSGLVGHWTFDGKDVNGTTANDTSGNNNTGTINGATTPAIGKLGQALSFNGTSTSNVSMGNTSQSVNSISFWAKPTSTSQYLIDLDGGTHYVWINAGAVTATGFTTPTIYVDGSATATFPDTNWHYITITTATSFSASNLTIGKEASNYFSGSLDDVRIYNRALSATEVSTLYHLGQDTVAAPAAEMGNTNGLVGYWSFDGSDISGTTVTDLTGNSNNGTFTSATPTIGKLGQALDFSSIGKYISVPNSGTLNPTRITMSAWIFPKATGFYAPVIYKSSPTSGDYAYKMDLSSDGDHFRGYVTLDATHWCSAADPTALGINQWYNYVFTYDGATCYLYKNGASVGTPGSQAGNVLGDGTSPMYIGGDSGDNFPGYIDEVRLYNRALSASEVLGLYNLGQAVIRK